MSADLRLSDLVKSPSQTGMETPAKNSSADAETRSSGFPRKVKIFAISVISIGLVCGLAVAYLIVTAPDRPDVDTAGKSMNVDIETGSKADLEKKLADPNVITNHFETHPVSEAEHPIDPSIEVARMGLKHIRENVKDYTAVFHKQERVGGKLMPKETIEVKIRHNSISNDESQSPMSIFVRFLAPNAMKGREVIWQKGQNKDRLTVHEYIFGRNVMLNLKPSGMLAMKGSRYPMTEAGIETLILRMIEKGVRDRQHGECEVKVNRSTKINGRDCTLIEISHPVKRDHFEFHIAKIYIDDELNLPISYTAFTWPTEEGGEPVMEESYTYTDLKLNVGLTDEDFDIKNPAYNFPK